MQSRYNRSLSTFQKVLSQHPEDFLAVAIISPISTEPACTTIAADDVCCDEKGDPATKP